MAATDRKVAARRKAAEEEAARNDLFSSDTPTSSLKHRKATSDEKAAQSVTEDLIELRELMHTQLQHSHDTMRVLVTSSGDIKRTHSGMNDIGVGINVGQGLISKLGRRDITDKVLIFLALIFFFCVVLYVIRKRLIGWII